MPMSPSSFHARRLFVIVLVCALLLGTFATSRSVFAASNPSITGLAAAGTTKPLLGEAVSYSFTFVNGGSSVGYSPFFELALDTSGPDGGATPDGFSAPSVSASGLALSPVGSVTLAAGQTTYTNSFTSQTRPVPSGFNTGDKIYIYQLPFGSFTAGQSTLVTITTTTSNKADVGTPLPLAVTPGFRDDDATAPFNPTYGSTATSDATPELFRLTKTYVGPEGETATGPNYKRRYRLDVDIAVGQTISTLKINDLLPNTMQWTGNANVVQRIAGSAIATNTTGTTATAATPGGTIVGNFGNVTGVNGVDASLEFEFYVPRDTTAGSEILPLPNPPLPNPAGGTDRFSGTDANRSSENNASTGGVWNPIDSRDTQNQNVSIDAAGPEHTLEEQSIATQKSGIAVAKASPNTAISGSVKPGTTLLRYSIDFQVSDYYAMDNIFLEDKLGDGQRLYLASGFAPTLTVQNPYTFTGGGTRAANSSGAFAGTGTIEYQRAYTIRNTADSDPTTANEGYDAAGPSTAPFNVLTPAATTNGTTLLRFNISQELIARGLPGLMVGGEIANGGGNPTNNNPNAARGPAQGTITYWVQVKESFSDDFPSGDETVDQGDILKNAVPLIQGDHLSTTDLSDGTPTKLNTTGTDDTGTSVQVARGLQSKTVYAINGVSINTQSAADTVFSVQAGDRVTYKLTYDLPISSFEDMKIVDLPPLPVMKVGPYTNYTFNRDSGSYSFANYAVGVAPDDTFFGTFPTFPSLAPATTAARGTITTDEAKNAIQFTFDDWDDIGQRRSTRISLLLTLPIGDDPFVSDLFLTNQMRVDEGSTNQDTQTLEDLRRFQLVQPQVTLNKGVVGYRNIGATLGGFSFANPTQTANWAGGTISTATNATAIGAANLTGTVDAGDVVRYAIVAQNPSRGDAYNVRISDKVQTGYTIPPTFAGLNLQVRRGNGTLLALGTDYTLVSYDNTTGVFEIELVDNYAAGNVNNSTLSRDDRLAGLSRGEAVSGVYDTSTGNPPATSITNGSNTVVVQYDLTLAANAAPNQAIVNTAKVTNLTASETGPDLTDPANVFGAIEPFDTATTTVQLPAQTKTLVGTEITQTGNAALNQATIGETVDYQLVVTVPEGQTPSAQIVDTLDAGLAFVEVTSVSASSGLSFTGGLPTVSGTPANTTITNSGGTITFDFGMITNADRDNATAETITIGYRAVVLNTAANQASQTRKNAARFIWTSNTTTLAQVSAANVTIVEPTLTTTKLVKNVTDAQGPATTVRADNNDVVEYTITINSASGSNTTAFDVSLYDLIPATVASPSIFSATSTGNVRINGALGTVAPANLQLSGSTLVFDPASNIDIEPGAIITIVVRGTFTGATGQIIANTDLVRWTSMDGTPSTNRAAYNAAALERSGADGPSDANPTGTASGTLNDYWARATANIDAPPLVRKTIVASSETTTTPSSAYTAPGVLTDRLAVGEVIRYRLYASIGEGTANNFQVRDRIPTGLQFLNDGNARFAFISTGGGQISSTGIANITGLGTGGAGGNLSGNEASLATLSSASIAGTFSDDNISTTVTGTGTGDPSIYNSAANVYFRFGNINNVDNDTDVEFVVIEFNALVSNINANIAGVTRSNDITLLVDTNADGVPGYVSLVRDNDGSGTNNAGDTGMAATDADNNATSGTDTPAYSTAATVTVLEPNIGIDKQVTATTGAIATYRVTITNTGSNVSAAHNTRIQDTLNGTDLSLVANSVNVVLANGATGATNTSAGNNVIVTVDFIPVGGSATITYQANVLTTPTGTTTLNNTAGVATTSLSGSNGSMPFFGTAQATLGTPGFPTGERNATTGTNIYTASDTERLGSLGDRVWVDINGNGVQDGGEPGIVGAPVAIRWAGLDGAFNTADDSLINTTTGANGSYTVTGLPVASPGQFQVTVNSGGAPFTTFGLNTLTDSVDNGTISAVNPTTVNLTTTTPNPRDQDFGYRGTASIGDTIWHDLNNNGVLDLGEPGIPNVQVTVTWHGQDNALGGGDDVVYSATTNASGVYAVGNLPAGNFTVAVSTASLPDNATQTYDLNGSQTDSTATRTLVTGETAADLDFGYRGDASIGDRVWYDVDGDGVQDNVAGDGDEPGIAGATVTLTFGGDDGDLTTAGDNISYSTTTGVNGSYLFANLFGGDFLNGSANNYRVAITPLAAYPSQTFDNDGLATANNSSLRLSAAQNNLLQDFGYRGPATQSLGDFVWEDLNGNGWQEAGEPGIVGANVELWVAGTDGTFNTGDDLQLDVTTTNGVGIYSFPNLVAGNYQVRVTAPSGYVFTAQDSAVATDATDSDVAQSGVNAGRTAVATVVAGAANPTVDAGLYRPVTIGDFVWFDVDGDGLQDAGEPGIEGATVTVTWYGPNGVPGGDDDATFTATTNPSGAWSIANLPPGNYGVAISTLPNGLTNKTAGPSTFVLVSGVSRTDIDFGFNGSASLGDRIWLDLNANGALDGAEDGIGGVTMTLVWFGPNGTLGGGDDVIKTTVTGPDGSYSFTNQPTGNFQVAVSGLPAGVTQTFDLDGTASANTAQISLNAGDNRTDLDFGYRGTGSLGDYVWLDADGDKLQDVTEEGIGGVGVTLTWHGLDGTFGNGDDITFTTVTDGDGLYNFAYLPAGQFRVAIAAGTLPAGLTPTDDLDGIATVNIATTSLTAGQNRIDADFGYRGTGSIGDRVWFDANGDKVQDGGEPGLAGVKITLSYAGPDNIPGNADDISFSTTTGANGGYDFAGLPAGTYSVDVDTSTAPGGTSLTTANDPLAVTLAAGEDFNGADFGFNGTGSLGDYIWLDRNGDKAQAGEPGIADVKVNLVWAGRDGDFATTADNASYTTTTDDAGAYSFGNLPAGAFRVSVNTATLPAGLTATYDLDTTADSTTDTTLIASQNRIDVDFGYRGTGSIGDLVWFDADGNGMRDGGEPGLANVAVTVTWYGPDGVAGGGDDGQFTTTTNPAGAYSIAGLPAGIYSVAVPTPPAGMAGTTTNPQTVTLGSGQNYVNADFGFSGTGSLGNRVWLNLDGDAVQDAGEPGIGGVKVNLVWAGNDGDFATTGDNITLSTTTNPTGIYGFVGLPPGKFAVAVDTTTLPNALDATFDFDGDDNSTAETTLAAGGNSDELDFGYTGTASIGDRVWLDLDGLGAFDAGEPGLNLVTVTVLWAGPNGTFNDADDAAITAETDGTGAYLVDGLPEGNYSVDVLTANVPVGTVRTNGNTPYVVSLADRQYYPDADFGFNGTGSLGDRVWLDMNGDGVQDAGEPGLSGITLDVVWAGMNGTLGDADDVTYPAITGADGIYTVNKLPAGPYRVTVTNAAATGLSATFDLDGSADSTTDTSLTAGQNRIDIDFGYKAVGSIGDLVWFDTDGDGQQDAGEPGIPGVTVTLRSKNGDLVFTQVTDQNGNYTFAGLPDGEYQVDVDQSTAPSGTRLTTANDPATSTVTGGKNNTDVDFGFTGAIALGDRVWLDRTNLGVQDGDEPGIAKVKLTLVWAGLDNDLTTAGDNITYTKITDPSGNYTFPNLPAGKIEISVDTTTLPGGVLPTFDLDGTADSTTIVTLTAGNSRSDVDFGYQGQSGIGDLVWFDANGNQAQDAGEPGLANVAVTVTWYGPDGVAGGGDDASFTTTTDSAGVYTVAGLPAGEYSVAVDTATTSVGSALTTDANPLAVTLPPNQNQTDVDFGFIGTVSLGDRVWLDMDGDGVQDANEPGLPNVKVLVVWAGPDGDSTTTGDNVSYSTTTDADGNYSVDKLPGGNFQVTVDTASLPSDLVATYDLDATADSTTDTEMAADQGRTDIDFGYRGPGALGDLIWFDLDSDGVRDAGEPGLANVTVTVTWFGPDGVAGGGDDVVVKTLTDGAGAYSFEGLPLGTYSVTVEAGVPDGVLITADPDASPDGTTQVDLTTVDPSRTDVDFGYSGSGSISQTVWLDDDRDGVVDSTEHGLANVTINLVWAGPDGVFGTADDVTYSTTTDGNGNYRFENLPAGNYKVDVDETTLPTNLLPTYDLDGGNDSAATVVLGPGENKPNVNFGFATQPTALTLSSFVAVRKADGTVELRWVTQAEINTLGFHILRSDDGTREHAIRITTELLPSRGGQGGTYTWLDSTARRNSAYTYWLEENEFDGASNIYGPATVRIATSEQKHTVFVPLVRQ